jgi:hypothetical protein
MSIALFAGALIPTLLLSRLFLYILKKWEGGWQKIVFANSMSLIVATLIGSIGMSNSGEFAAAKAFEVYILPQLVWLAYDLYKLKKKRTN